MAGYCTHCGGSGFRKPSREPVNPSAYVLRVLALGERGIAAELERLQAIIATERQANAPQS